RLDILLKAVPPDKCDFVVEQVVLLGGLKVGKPACVHLGSADDHRQAPQLVEHVSSCAPSSVYPPWAHFGHTLL
ncbi:MAG: hypothetical protein ACXWDF_12025, partial [Aeromicrobium sp.]